ncbi:MAG: methyltransferase [Roseiarcus sp.]|jgi:protein-S-isoprenylcysteine O-methyltransferase Ste14
MSVVLKSSLFDEPAAAEAEAAAKKFKFAATFVIDLAFSLLFVAAVVPVWAGEMDRGLVLAPTFLLGVLILACYAGKVFVIAHLDKAGGDARTYVKSSALVTDGPYAYSRNPTYLLAMVQFLLWSALAFYLQAFAPWRPTMLAAAILLPALFFLVNDRVVMPTEEAMLRRLHPDEFEAYASRVRRWLGRRAAAD